VAGQFTYTPYAGVQWRGNQPGVGGVYLFFDAWRRFGFGEVPPSNAVASATTLVIDVSGSMGEAWQGGVKIESARRAAADVINMIEQESQIGATDHQVAIATFTNNATLNLEPTTDYGAARQALDALVPLNRTNIGAGLQVANQALTAAPAGAQKIIILLSDGLTNEGLSRGQILSGPVAEAAAAGTCIYTVGFGDPGDLDETLLRQIAEGSGCGAYTYASAPDELERVYIRLRHQSMGTVLAEFEGQIAQGETAEVGQVDVPPNQGEMYVTLHWPGSDLDLIVTDPRGRQVDLDSSQVSLVEYEGLTYLIIQNPLPGAWLLEAFGADVPEGLLRYDVIVSVRERTGPPPVNTQVILLLVALAGGAAVIVAIVVTQQRRPRPAMAGLQVAGAEGSQPFTPLRGRQLTIGRDPRCGMVLADPLVSARHAAIRRAPQGYELTDLGSTHGTFVNGQEVEQALLRGGERLRLGDSELVFVVPGAQPPSPQPMSGRAAAYLAVMSGDEVFGRCALGSGTVLGRHAGCPVDLSADALVSRQHARLDYQDGQWTITDLESGNGTFVNGRQVTSQVLQQGDEVRLGNTRMKFQTA
jgi:pSer/pThr/pTyr-binding forkhead associated (FHA) protein